MEYRRGREIVARLDEDDEIVESVLAICRKEGIGSAYLQGIGALKKAEISHFDTVTKQYGSTIHEGMIEIASMSGNIAKLYGEPSAHIHIVLGLKDFAAAGGHLVKGIVNPTCEIVIIPVETGVRRENDEKTGLNLHKFE